MSRIILSVIPCLCEENPTSGCQVTGCLHPMVTGQCQCSVIWQSHRVNKLHRCEALTQQAVSPLWTALHDWLNQTRRHGAALRCLCTVYHGPTGSNAQWFTLVLFFYALSNNAIDDELCWQRKPTWCPFATDFGIMDNKPEHQHAGPNSVLPHCMTPQICRVYCWVQITLHAGHPIFVACKFLQPPTRIQNTSHSWARDRQSVIAAKVRAEPGLSIDILTEKII